MYNLEWIGTFETIEHSYYQASLLDEWEPEHQSAITQLRAGAGCFWLYSPANGAIQFNSSSGSVFAYPLAEDNAPQFEKFIFREWLPLVYTIWGCQVLHASAAVQLSSNRVVAFAGPAGYGKSTIGYGLGQRPGWRQIADESLGFTVGEARINLVQIPNLVRLRPASAAHYRWKPSDCKQLDWPAGEMSLAGLYFLEPDPDPAGGTPPVRFIPLDGVEAYPLFLRQAFALTLKLPEHNQRLMQDYIEIARQTPAFRMYYSKSYATLDRVLDAVEARLD